MKAISIRLKTAEGREGRYIVHDFRLYDPEKLPFYIDPSRKDKNKVLVWGLAEGPPRIREGAKELMERIEDESKELFKELKRKGLIAKNQGYKLKSHLAYGILTLSHEAQKDVKDQRKLEEFLHRAKEYLENLAEALGTDLIYAVVHLDETAPHIHFALRNLRTREPDPEAVQRLGWGEEELEVLRRGVGKSVIATFQGSVAKSWRNYNLHFSRLQDSLNFFEPVGFGRGIPRAERVAKGEPYWKWTTRSLRRLHEDLPREIEYAEKRLKELEEKIREARKAIRSEKRRLKRKLIEMLKKARIRVKEVGVFKKEKVISLNDLGKFLDMVAEELVRAGQVVETAERLKREVGELGREVIRMRKEIEELEMERQRLKVEIKRLRSIQRELEEEQEPGQTQIQENIRRRAFRMRR